MAREAPEPRFGLEPVYYFFRPVPAPNNGYPVCGGDRGLQNVRQSLVEQRHAGRRLGAGLHTLRPNDAPQFRKKFVIDRRPCRSSIRHSLSRVSGAFVRTNFIF